MGHMVSRCGQLKRVSAAAAAAAAEAGGAAVCHGQDQCAGERDEHMSNGHCWATAGKCIQSAASDNVSIRIILQCYHVLGIPFEAQRRNNTNKSNYTQI